MSIWAIIGWSAICIAIGMSLSGLICELKHDCLPHDPETCRKPDTRLRDRS